MLDKINKPDQLDSRHEPSNQDEGFFATENSNNRLNEIAEQDESGAAADGSVDKPTTSRFRIRAAISSVYGPKPGAGLDEEALELARAAAKLIRMQAEALVNQAKELAQNGEIDRALQILTQAVRIDNENSVAWTWLGGLLINRNLERAKFCLTRALELDPENSRAQRGLEQIEILLTPPPPPSETALVKVVEETDDKTDKATIKIGLDEAVEERRKSGQDADPQGIPLGGAKLRALAEREGLVWPKRKRKRRYRLPLPHLPPLPRRGLKLSLILLAAMSLFTALGFWIIIARPSFEPAPTPTPDPNPTTTPVPTATLTIDEGFGVRVRAEIDSYNRLFATVKDLRQQFDNGKIRWEDLRRGYKDIQGQLRETKKRVDGLANKVTSKLLPTYKSLQDIAQISITAADFMVSGVDTVSDEDLNEGTRQFNRAIALLIDVARQLDILQPLPTPAPTSTPALTNTAALALSPAPTPTPTLPLDTPLPASLTTAPATTPQPASTPPAPATNVPEAAPTPAPTTAS